MPHVYSEAAGCSGQEYISDAVGGRVYNGEVTGLSRTALYPPTTAPIDCPITQQPFNPVCPRFAQH